MQRSAPHPFPLLWCAQCPLPPLLCVLFSSLFIIIFFVFLFFLQGRDQTVQGATLVYPRDTCGNTACHLLAHLLVCISQAGLEPASGSVAPLLFSQCNVAWRSFVQARGLGCQSFASSSGFFFCQMWLQHLSNFSDLWSSCYLLPPSSHHLGSSGKQL
jgi:hypothetical protein